MPVTIKMGGNTPSAPQKPSKPTKSSGDKQPSVPLVIAGCVLAFLFVGYMFVHFVIQPVPTVAVTKLPPPPGFPDMEPYNTKEWQDKNKDGQANRLTGVPPVSNP